MHGCCVQLHAFFIGGMWLIRDSLNIYLHVLLHILLHVITYHLHGSDLSFFLHMSYVFEGLLYHRVDACSRDTSSPRWRLHCGGQSTRQSQGSEWHYVIWEPSKRWTVAWTKRNPLDGGQS